jgi:DNA polymerase III epsilon subunit family exonuclease
VETVLWAAFVVFAVVVVVRYFLRDRNHPTPESILNSELNPTSVVPPYTPSAPVHSGVETEATSTVSATIATNRAHSIPDFLPKLPRQFVVLDLETTGLDPKRHEIIEIGAIQANLDSDTHPTFQTLVKPESRIPREITAINGITQAMVEESGTNLTQALAEFLDFIQDLPLVTFNAQFDMAFLDNAARKHGLTINNRYTCALQLARKAWPELPSHRLVDLAKLGNLPNDNTHRALGDCRRALTIFIAAADAYGRKISWNRLPTHEETVETVRIG